MRQALFDLLVIDDHDVILAKLVKYELSLALSPINDDNFLAIKELVNFILPIVSQCSWADHNVARSINNLTMLLYLCLFDFLTFIQHDTQRLQCLAKAHIITKGTIEIVVPKLGHPIDALFLVWPQLASCRFKGDN